MKILVETDKTGKIRIINKDSNTDITNSVKRIDIFINYKKEVSVMLEFQDVELKIRGNYENTQGND